MNQRRLRSIKVPAYNVAGVASSLQKGVNTATGLAELLPLFTGESTATTQGQVIGQSLSDVASGAATGMKIGSQFGGVGAIVGGGVGAIAGAIGKKGRYASMTSFTDYDEGTFSTGLRALGGANSRRRRERARIKANAYDNRDAIRGTSELENDYFDEFGPQYTDTFDRGGQSSSLAYVDDGELLRTPDGVISKVPERNRPTDSNLVNLPDHTRILSDSLKVPGRKETFAQLGEKMITKRKSKYKDIYAENAAKLNQMNNDAIYNQLFTLQEAVKRSKGIKPKVKGVQAYENAGQTGKFNKYAYDPKLSNFSYWDTATNNYKQPYLDWVGKLTQDDVNAIYNGAYGDMSTYLKANEGHIPTVEEARRLMTDQKYGDWHKIGKAYVDAKIDSTQENGNYPDNYRFIEPVTPMKPDRVLNPVQRSVANPVGTMRYDQTGGANLDPGNKKDKGKSGSGFDWEQFTSDMVGSLSALPGIISDLTTTPEKFDAVYNPYANTIRNVMKRRRYDISAAMADANRNRAVSNYNANQFNTNTGANLAYRLQSARNYDNYVANLRNTKNNAENQYSADYANTLNDLGKQWVNSTNLAVDQNARSRAAARNIQRQGYSELANLGQTWAKSYNERRRDKELLPLYAEFLKSSFSSDSLKNLLRGYIG